MNGTYDPWLVMLSMAVAAMASYGALDLASRVTASTGRAAHYWLASGAVSMGMGIWSMHFIAMLAFRLPMPMSYSVSITALSLLIAMLASGFALYTVSRASLGLGRLLGGAVLMGIGIAAMHYTGMAAMQMSPPIRYDPLLFALSIVVAIVVSLVALWLAFRLRGETLLSAFWRKAGSAVLMGAAICGMHYTGMAAAIFSPHTLPTAGDPGVSSAALAVTIGTITVMLLTTTLLVSISAARSAQALDEHQRGARRLQVSNDELEGRVRERTTELARSNTTLEAEIAEHQRTEQALRASEDEAREIVDTAYDAYIGMDASSRIIEWNQKAEQTFGWTRAAVLGKNLTEFIIPLQHREAHASGLASFLATGEGPVLNKRIEISAVHRDGREFPVELTIWPVRMGDSYKFNAFLHDISDRQQAIRRLAAQTMAAAVLVEAASVAEAAPKVLEAVATALDWSVGALWTVDSDANVLRCTEFWRQQGSSVEAFEQLTRSMTFAPQVGLPGRIWSSGQPLWIADVTGDTNFPRASSASEDGLHAAFGFPIISGTRVLGVAEFFSFAIQQPDPDLLRMMDTLGSLLGQFIERKRAESKLEQDGEFLSALLENLSDGIVACDEHGTLSLFNRATREFHGLPEQPLPPEQWSEHYDLYLADGQTPMPMEQIPLFRALQGEAIHNVEIVIAPKARPRRTLLCDGRLLITPAGKKLGAVVALHDITERKYTEALLAGQKRVLEAIALGRPLPETLTTLLQTLEALSPAMISSVLLLDADGAHLRHVASAGLPEAFRQAVASVPIGPSVGSSSTAALRRAPLIVEDIASDPLWAGHADLALSHGLRACWSTPILDADGGLLGTFAIYYRQPGPPTAQDLRLVEFATQTAAIAISRLQAGLALRQSEARFATAFRNVPDGIVISRLSDGRVLEVNQSWCALSGWSREETEGCLIQELGVWVNYSDRERYADCLRKDGRVKDLELVMRRKSGELRNVSLSSELIEVDGQMLILALARDITERTQSELELGISRRGLVENQQRLEEAQEIAHVGNWEWDVPANTLTWSDELYRIYGLSADSFDPSYDAYLQRVHPDDREAIDSAVRSAMQTRKPFTFEHRLIRPDGVIRVMQAKGRVIANDQGEIVRMLGTGQDVTERKQAEARLVQLAQFDPLTGLPNRRQFYDSLRSAMALADRQGWQIPILFLDLDRFKNVNDTLGHVVGDELLRQVGERLLGCLRLRDTVGRLGGDEFGIILITPRNPQLAAQVANKLIQALHRPFDLDGREVTVTTSIGITVYPADSTDLDTLVRYADTAMYEAKAAGRDTYRFYTAEMNARALEKLELENALRKALERGEFVLHYQPKIDIGSGRCRGVEALLRWNRPGLGLVAPDEFIPTLEETGLITQVGVWVIDEACRQLAAWRQAGSGPLSVAVNVSARQVMRVPIAPEEQLLPGPQPGAIAESMELESAVAATMREHRIAPGQLELELTESTLMSHAELNASLLRRLRAQGVSISIDDFGTGYSSLAYLKRLPVQSIKIDRAFIRDVTSDPEDAAIVIAIITLAHSLKLTVVAEGVETAVQLEFLRAHGCDEAQGYHIARPMPASALLLWLAEQSDAR